MFFDPTEFSFLAPIKEAWRSILREYDRYASALEPWPERELYSGGWGTINFCCRGRWDRQTEDACPLTTKLLREVPGLYIAGFSVLSPGTVIYPHTGYTDTVLRSHLGLSCRGGAQLMVDGEVRSWKDGEMLVFNDRVEHSAENRGLYDRVILIVDFAKGEPHHAEDN